MRTAPTAHRASGAGDDATDAPSRESDGPGSPGYTDGNRSSLPGSLPVALPAGRSITVPSWVLRLALAGIVVAGIALRFVSRTNLWLDEALSVNIASADSIGDVFEGLKHDGHPPLYYVLLHYWMQIVGEGDVAIRALSGVCALAALPLAWVAGRRLAGGAGARWALILVALSPYWIRYATEARMYSLVMLLVLAGYLLVGDALKRPRPIRLAGLAAVSGFLLLSHYWAFWLLGAVILLLAWRCWREPAERLVTFKVMASVAAGGLLFLPWLPNFLYQARNTGTPWAGPVRPLAIVHLTLGDLGGGVPLNEAFIYSLMLVILCLLALFVVRSDQLRLTLDLRTAATVRPELSAVALTVGIGAVMGYLTTSTYQSRYAAVFVPLIFIAAAVGLVRLVGVARLLVGGTLVGLSLLGVGWTLYYQRTQSGPVAQEIAARAEAGDVVVYCPDQLGPAYSREMPDGLVELAYPALDAPDRVDWVNYGARNAAADPLAIAEQVQELAGDSSVFVVWRGGYETFGTQCEELVGRTGQGRAVEQLISQDTGKYYEPANLFWIHG